MNVRQRCVFAAAVWNALVYGYGASDTEAQALVQKYGARIVRGARRGDTAESVADAIVLSETGS